MQLKLRRSQRQGGVISTTAIFCVDARVEFTSGELHSINRYKLGKQVIYNSEASRQYLDRANAQRDGSTAGALKSLASIALAAMNLNITIAGLQKGQHIECKSMDELLGAEEALLTACSNLKTYLETAASFDGREVVIDFELDQMAIVAHSSPAAAMASPPPMRLAPAPMALVQSVRGDEFENAQWEPANDPAGSYQPPEPFFAQIMQLFEKNKAVGYAVAAFILIVVIMFIIGLSQ